MRTPTVLIAAAVMSLMRKELTTRCVADRFGVTEAQVLEWKDVFTIGGILALSETGVEGSPASGSGVSSSQNDVRCGKGSATAFSPTVTPSNNLGDPTTHPPHLTK